MAKAAIKNKKEMLVERRNEEILVAARHVFAQNGYRLTTVDEIANYLKVGKGTIYRYFSDKKALFLGVYEKGIRKLRETIRGKVDAIENPKEKVTCAIRTYLEYFEGQRELIEIVMQMRSEFKEDYKRIFLSVYDDAIEGIKKTLRNGTAAGIFRKMDVEKTAEVMSATLEGVLQNFYVRDLGGRQKEKLTDRTQAVTELVLNGLLERDGK
jgi:AcrR family transcriptional regulator